MSFYGKTNLITSHAIFPMTKEEENTFHNIFSFNISLKSSLELIFYSWTNFIYNIGSFLDYIYNEK